MRKPYVSKFVTEYINGAKITPNKWVDGYANVDTTSGLRRIPAELMEDFAVHRMIGHKGFSITYAPAGFRITSGGLVFKTANWAKSVAEQLYPISNDWGLYLDWPFPELTVKKFMYIFAEAQYQGAFFEDGIDAPDRITKDKLAAMKDWDE